MTQLSQYVGPTEVLRRRGKTYLYDAGSDVIIAELTPEAADSIKSGQPTRLTYDGHGTVTVEAP